MKYRAIAFAGWIVVAALVGFGLAAADAPPWTPFAVLVAIFAVQQSYCWILAPRGARARLLLSDDFAIVVRKRRFGQRVYIRLLTATHRQLRGEDQTEAVVAHPDEPDVVWVRSTTSAKPRFGPGFVATTWARISLTPDGSRVREISTGVLHVT